MLFTPDDLKAVGSSSVDFIKGVSKDVLKNTCDLYRQYPRGFGISNPIGDTVQAFGSGDWDTLCGGLEDPSLPDPPEQPFLGGQCDGVAYRFRIEIYNESAGGWWYALPNGYGGGYFEHWGPIGGVRRELTGTGGAGPGGYTGANVFVVSRGSTSAPISTTQDRVVIGTSPVEKVRIINLSRSDNAPDTCGDPPAEYPPGLPNAANPRTYSHTGNDGIQRDIPYTINFSPEFNGPTINFPDLPNICLSFELYGVDIDLCTNKPPEGDGSGISSEDLQALLEGAQAAKDALDKALELTRDGDASLSPQPEKEGEDDKDGEEDMLGILLTITHVPSGYGRQFGNPDQFILGRISFKRGAFYTAPEDISFVQQYYPAPPEATGYAISYANGVKGQVTIIRRAD